MFHMSIKGYSFYFRWYCVLTKNVTVNHLTFRSVVKYFSNRHIKARQFYEKHIQSRQLLTFLGLYNLLFPQILLKDPLKFITQKPMGNLTVNLKEHRCLED